MMIIVTMIHMIISIIIIKSYINDGHDDDGDYDVVVIIQDR